MRPAAALAERLGLPVRDLGLLQQALIHSSYLHEHRDLADGHNERLEFLGDSVVSLAISDALYRRHEGDDEGVLSARRASIVSTAGLARLANRLELGEYLLLGEGESQRGGRRRPGLLASAFEAVVGAVYLDLGYEAASGFVVSLASPELTSDRPPGSLKSPKSRLQEFTQRMSGERPQYRLVEATGPDHDKIFRVEVAVGGRVVGVGEGHSRRLAETEAAARAIETLRGQAGEMNEGAPELAEFAPPDADVDAAVHDGIAASPASGRAGVETGSRPGGKPGGRLGRTRMHPTPAGNARPGEASAEEPWIEMDIEILNSVPHTSAPGGEPAAPATEASTRSAPEKRRRGGRERSGR
jgi:ribonuclease-3